MKIFHRYKKTLKRISEFNHAAKRKKKKEKNLSHPAIRSVKKNKFSQFANTLQNWQCAKKMKLFSPITQHVFPHIYLLGFNIMSRHTRKVYVTIREKKKKKKKRSIECATCINIFAAY